MFDFDVGGEDGFWFLNGFEAPVAFLTDALPEGFTAGGASYFEDGGLRVRTLRAGRSVEAVGHCFCCSECGVVML